MLIGVHPGRRRVHPALLTLIHLLAMAAHAFLGFVLMQATTIIGADWYTGVHPPWAGPLRAGQRLGAGLAWAFGELPAAVVCSSWNGSGSAATSANRPASTGPPTAPRRHPDNRHRSTPFG